MATAGLNTCDATSHRLAFQNIILKERAQIDRLPTAESLLCYVNDIKYCFNKNIIQLLQHILY